MVTRRRGKNKKHGNLEPTEKVDTFVCYCVRRCCFWQGFNTLGGKGIRALLEKIYEETLKTAMFRNFPSIASR